MPVLLYTAGTNRPGRILRRVVETLVREDEREVYDTIDSLSQRLKRPHASGDLTLAILLAETSSHLRELINVRELLKDIQLILVLPNRNAKTIRNGSQLRPRFISYVDSDFLDVSAVLSRMLNKVGSKRSAVGEGRNGPSNSKSQRIA